MKMSLAHDFLAEIDEKCNSEKWFQRAVERERGKTFRKRQIDREFYDACRYRNWEDARKMREKGATFDYLGTDDMTAIHHIARNGHAVLLGEILTDNPEEIERKRPRMQTALGTAIEFGQRETALVVLSRGTRHPLFQWIISSRRNSAKFQSAMLTTISSFCDLKTQFGTDLDYMSRMEIEIDETLQANIDHISQLVKRDQEKIEPKTEIAKNEIAKNEIAKNESEKTEIAKSEIEKKQTDTQTAEKNETTTDPTTHLETALNTDLETPPEAHNTIDKEPIVPLKVRDIPEAFPAEDIIETLPKNYQPFGLEGALSAIRSFNRTFRPLTFAIKNEAPKSDIALHCHRCLTCNFAQLSHLLCHIDGKPNLLSVVKMLLTDSEEGLDVWKEVHLLFSTFRLRKSYKSYQNMYTAFKDIRDGTILQEVLDLDLKIEQWEGLKKAEDLSFSIFDSHDRSG